MTDSTTTKSPTPHDDATCILCGRCLAVCPLFGTTQQEELSPRAKKFLLQEVANRGEGLSQKAVQDLAGLCLGCERCVAECPQGVDVPGALTRLKAGHPGWKGWVWKQIITRSGTLFPLLSQWGSRVPGVLPDTRMAQLRAMSAQDTLTPWVRVRGFDTCGRGEKVLLFAGCTGRYTRPLWNENSKTLLSGLGFRVLDSPDWGCCGHTLGLAGLQEDQRAMQVRNLSLWRGLGRPRIVAYCATCLTGLSRMPRADLGWETGEREEWTRAVTPLAAVLGETKFQLLDTAPEQLVLHRPCHSPDLGAAFGPLGDFIQSSGLEVTVQDDCCGLGGSMQLEAPGLSRRVATCFWDKGKTPGQVLTACSGCVLQLTASAPQGTLVGHWLDVLTFE